MVIVVATTTTPFGCASRGQSHHYQEAGRMPNRHSAKGTGEPVAMYYVQPNKDEGL
jgi:hypothetical protein